MYLAAGCQYRSKNFWDKTASPDNTKSLQDIWSFFSSWLFSPSPQHQSNRGVLERQVLSQLVNQVTLVTLRYCPRRVDEQSKSGRMRSSLRAIVEFHRLTLRQRRCVSFDDLLQCLIHGGGRNFLAVC